MLIAPVINWITAPTAKAATARAIAKVMVADPAYICRDEYTDGFSADGKTWTDNAAHALVAFFLEDPEMQNRLYVQASDPAGHFLGGAVIEPGHNGYEKWWTIEDLIVAPAARRSGVGQALISFLMAQAKIENIARLMLESGVTNSAAHALFMAEGFAPVSTLYALNIKP